MHYLHRRQMDLAARLLDEGCSVTACAAQLGFDNVQVFARNFKRRHGTAPSHWGGNDARGEPRTP